MNNKFDLIWIFSRMYVLIALNKYLCIKGCWKIDLFSSVSSLWVFSALEHIDFIMKMNDDVDNCSFIEDFNSRTSIWT